MVMTEKEVDLLHMFAGQAMQSLILVGTNSPNLCVSKTGHEYESPSQPWYFGNWDKSKEKDVIEGVESMAYDSYQAAEAMVKISREFTSD